jgi:hypothetical protein
MLSMQNVNNVGIHTKCVETKAVQVPSKEKMRLRAEG